MSNQFYNYISGLIIEYLNRVTVNPGDRFYLQLDRQQEVIQFTDSFRDRTKGVDFFYQHEYGEPYRTFCTPIGDVKLVFASTTEGVTPDFLVTLRNQVGEQKGVWANTALFSVVSHQLDSIQGGSSDLQKEGMPLHPDALMDRLTRDIEESSLKKTEKIILQDHMKRIIEDRLYQQVTFFEFEDILTTLTKGNISDKEYGHFGLFRDSELDTFQGSKLIARLDLNRELYAYVQRIHDFGLDEDNLQDKFSESGSKMLRNEEWAELSFSEVNKFHQEYLDEKKKTSLELKHLSVEEKLAMWDRPQKETAAGQRKRHIILFNPDQLDKVHLTFAFSFSGKGIKSLSKDFLRTFGDENIEVSVGRTNVSATLNTKRNNPTFHRLAYRHESKASLGAEFFITVVPIEPTYLAHFKASYLVNPSKNLVELQFDGEELVFGQGFDRKTVDVDRVNQVMYCDSDSQLTVRPQSEAFSDEEELVFSITWPETDTVISFLLRNEIPESIPVTGSRIWKLKREFQQDFDWIGGKLLFGNRQFYLNTDCKNFFEWEQQWRDVGMQSADLISDALIARELSLGDRLREAYSRFLNHFKSKPGSGIPSLCHYDDDLSLRAEEYVRAYIDEIKSFEEGYEAGKKGKDLFRLGCVYAPNCIYFTPYHPLVVAFQLKASELLSNEDVENSILGRLRPNSLVPYIYGENGNLYKPDEQNYVTEWVIYKPVQDVTVADANKFLAKVVEEKLSQFISHFNYLFVGRSRAAIRINVISIDNDHEVVRGLATWMLRYVEAHGLDTIRPIEVTEYREGTSDSAFEKLASSDSVEDFELKFGITLTSGRYDAVDLLKAIQRNVFYYKARSSSNYSYAHISYYKMHVQDAHAVQPMKDMMSGIALDGLYSSVPSMKSGETYRNGFGIRGYSLEDDNILVQAAYYLNELCGNLKNDGFDTYWKGQAVHARVTTADEKILEAIFKSSYWVTFVDPSVGLEFFNNYNKNLVVIHYSDQYSSSTRYDAITVTDKSEQYYSVIKEFLEEKKVTSSVRDVLSTIKAFNTFNGEWLLHIIGSKGQYSREKLSVVSAIKFSLAYFHHDHILWVPVSLEEILRVAGAVSLSKSDGVFTAKNLGVTGSHSDDILLLGLESKDGKLHLHFYPVEVKIGINGNSVLEKAKLQVIQTHRLIAEALGTDNNKPFTSKFYRNFFAQLFIANANKITSAEFWAERDYTLSDKTIERLLKDDYSISERLKPLIGDGAVLSFQKDAFHRSAHLENGITYLNLTEQDGYSGIIKPMPEMIKWIQEKDGDLDKAALLSHRYFPLTVKNYSVLLEENHTVDQIAESKPLAVDIEKVDSDPRENSSNGSAETTGSKTEDRENSGGEQPQGLLQPGVETNPTIEAPQSLQEKGDKRVLLGTAENSVRQIFWEYGNRDLPNRHMLISGKSGQGKTYFIQCLLLEMSKQGISSIVVDYTEGFLPNQLEEDFKNVLGSKLNQKIVFTDKFPINPFKRNVRDIGGYTLPESDTDIAERTKTVFASVYNTLGIQQLNAIYDAVLKGLGTYREEMSLAHLRTTLEEDGSNYAKTALSQVRPLIDRNPFSNEENINWNDVVQSKGEVFVIQLAGYPRDVQLLITEFILWDLWNYAVRFGNKDTPIPLIMDEAQNLDHTEGSPSARILTEGRKFGISAWYATQFLKSQLNNDELARLQNASLKVYFAQPEQEVSFVASSLATDTSEKKVWEKRVSSLKKGQCVVNGQFVNDDGRLSNPVATVLDVTRMEMR